MSTDSIADMLTRIRNANTAGHSRVALPASRVGVEIARVLKEEGYIAAFDVAAAEQGQKLDITFKPKSPRGKSLAGLRRISKPGLRVYARKTEIPRVLGGLGIVILSTSHGVMSGQKATKVGVGYRASRQGEALVLNVGFSHPVRYPVPKGITIDVPEPTRINIKGASKEDVGQVAAEVRKIRPPEPYKGKGILYRGERIRRKAGKTGKTAGAASSAGLKF